MVTIFKLQFLTLIFFISIFSFGQMPQMSTIGGNPMAAAQHFAGDGVTIINAQFIGDVNQCATFTNGFSTIGISEGIALTTGNASFAGTSHCGGCGDASPVDNNNIDDDPDIDVITNLGQYAPAALEFEFTSIGSQIEFQFVFASKEYPGYVGSDYNDLFALVLSGPGIDGDFSNNGENIALVPKPPPLDVPISINTINNGTFNGSVPATNPDLFIANYPQVQPFNQIWRYDGQTVVLTIKRNVQCNRIYKLRLVIANIEDYNRDSGVFFKKGSLKSPFNLGELTAFPSPVCEGQPIFLSIEGEDDYIYSWSDGQEGINLKNITTLASIGINSYSVQVSTADGCKISSSSIDVNVNSNDNTPPYMNGINNTGIYDVYVRALDLIEFQIPTFDSENENVNFFWLPPSLGNRDIINLPKGIGLFDWIPSFDAMGIYEIFAICNDNNACGSLPSQVYQFNIHVVCPYCEISVDYANRSPQSNPLPPLTEAAAIITAGINGPVEVGNDQVIFRAPTIILDAVGFETGLQFIAENEGVCTETVCDKCCESNYNKAPDLLFPGSFTPNGDGVNDIWHIVDLTNPFCAFNSKSTELNIYDRWGTNLVFNKIVNSAQCCAFKSPPAPYADILNPLSWNGTYNVNSWQNPPIGTLVDNDTYFYTYRIVTCSETLEGAGYITVAAGSARYAFQESNQSVEENRYSYSIQKFEFLIYPNPSKDFFNVRLLNSFNDGTDYKLVLNDLTGRTLAIFDIKNNITELDLSNFANGCYFISLLDLNNKFIAQSKIIKQ